MGSDKRIIRILVDGNNKIQKLKPKKDRRVNLVYYDMCMKGYYDKQPANLPTKKRDVLSDTFDLLKKINGNEAIRKLNLPLNIEPEAPQTRKASTVSVSQTTEKGKVYAVSQIAPVTGKAKAVPQTAGTGKASDGTPTAETKSQETEDPIYFFARKIRDAIRVKKLDKMVFDKDWILHDLLEKIYPIWKAKSQTMTLETFWTVSADWFQECIKEKATNFFVDKITNEIRVRKLDNRIFNSSWAEGLAKTMRSLWKSGETTTLEKSWKSQASMFEGIIDERKDLEKETEEDV